MAWKFLGVEWLPERHLQQVERTSPRIPAFVHLSHFGAAFGVLGGIVRFVPTVREGAEFFDERRQLSAEFGFERFTVEGFIAHAVILAADSSPFSGAVKDNAVGLSDGVRQQAMRHCLWPDSNACGSGRSKGELSN